MRKRLTEIFPFLLPLRIIQRNFCYFLKMKYDGNMYSEQFGECLPYLVSEVKEVIINENSGYDRQYQVNKADNLKLVSKTMNHIVIKPDETFSFCRLLRNASQYGEYKEGLVLIDNKIVPRKGGGVCQLSNLLYYVFLKSPLTIMERHGHIVKSIPDSSPNALFGVDATIHSGWLDLKIKNETKDVYQIEITFDEQCINVRLLCSSPSNVKYEIKNRNKKYIRKNNSIYESAEVIKEMYDIHSNQLIFSIPLYTEETKVTYKLPENIEIEEQ